MELIRKLGTRLDKKGYLRSWAVFWCNFCESEVEKIISKGRIAKSCGCVHDKLVSESLGKGMNHPKYKHGESLTRLYEIWKSMKKRILNPKASNYKNYGGRGITICNEWLEFTPFRDWSLNNGYANNLTIDRRNNNDNYEPLNCRWITQEEQQKNKRNTIVRNNL